LNLGGGFNPYGYVHNPVRFVDPFGLSSDKITLYHAGNLQGPIDPSRGESKRDFDPRGKGGFYTTASKEQALKWSKMRNHPTLATFEIPKSELDKLNIKVLDTSTPEGKKEWVEFIKKGRNGTLVHNHDAVIGPMLMNLKEYRRGAAPTAAGHQLALYTDKAAKLFDEHLSSVQRVANGKIVDDCP
ncbi:DUF3990 domain-containing protein, partial [Xenorhabdus sp. XENO-1]|uniref:DUF3990 domain-containing protein n=1 Tax=Xenorhabdus bovienii TaxID=40576 RepID=UPI0020CA3E8B